MTRILFFALIVDVACVDSSSKQIEEFVDLLGKKTNENLQGVIFDPKIDLALRVHAMDIFLERNTLTSPLGKALLHWAVQKTDLPMILRSMAVGRIIRGPIRTQDLIAYLPEILAEEKRGFEGARELRALFELSQMGPPLPGDNEEGLTMDYSTESILRILWTEFERHCTAEIQSRNDYRCLSIMDLIRAQLEKYSTPDRARLIELPPKI